MRIQRRSSGAHFNKDLILCLVDGSSVQNKDIFISYMRYKNHPFHEFLAALNEAFSENCSSLVEGKLDQIAAGVNLRVIHDAQISLCDIFGKI